jgi:hypothetical protein
VNRWVSKHTDVLLTGLEDDEQLLAACRVSLTGQAASADTRARRPNVDLARRLGFPLPSRVFVLGISNRRLLLWRTTLWLAKPAHLGGSLPLQLVAAVRTTRLRGTRRLVVLLESGVVLTVGPLLGGGLAELDAAFSIARPEV